MDYPSLVTVITTQGFAAPTEFWTNLSETSNNIILAHVQFSKGDHRPKIEGSNLPQGITAGALHRFSDVICFVATSPDIHTELSKLWIDGNKQYGLPNKAAAYFLRVVDDKSVDNALDKHENERTSLTSNSKPYFHVLAYGMTDMSWTTSKESWPEEIGQLSHHMLQLRLSCGRGWEAHVLKSLLSHWSGLESNESAETRLANEFYEVEEEVRVLTEEPCHTDELGSLIKQNDDLASWEDGCILRFFGLLLAQHAMTSSHWSPQKGSSLGATSNCTLPFSFFHWKLRYDLFARQCIRPCFEQGETGKLKAVWLEELQRFADTSSSYSTRRQFISRITSRDNFVSLLRSRPQNEYCDICLCERWYTRLPCSHLLCLLCVQARSNLPSRSPHILMVGSCPLCRSSGARSPLLSLSIQPRSAPFRVLDLDGGGVKGIVQIEALRSVSKAIGLDLPISSYFDLIVGTSIGGICAIGIGLNGWSLGECAEKLKLLIGCAFRDRSSAASKVPSFLMICKRALRLLLSGAVYSESYITSSLQSAFGKTPLVSCMAKKSACHVAVLVDNVSKGSCQILPSYNIPRTARPTSSLYHRARIDPNYLCLGQATAAQATSAAPIYCNTVTIGDEVYQDGATRFNNSTIVASEEATLLSGCRTTPIYSLSVGCGTYDFSERSSRLLGRIKDYVYDQSDAQRQHDKFFSQVAVDDKNIFRRLNPPLSIPDPPLDDIDQIDVLQKEAISTLTRSHYATNIAAIARELIASMFYINVTRKVAATRNVIMADSDPMQFIFKIHTRYDRRSLAKLGSIHEYLGLIVNFRGRKASAKISNADEIGSFQVTAHYDRLSARMPVCIQPNVDTTAIGIDLRLRECIIAVPGSPFRVADLVSQCDPADRHQGEKRKR